ncbi:MAG: hypothetical protein Q4D12_06440 [Bacteroidales bacterium]|nr:hypothetical protein [Bacteroidales bacterium]
MKKCFYLAVLACMFAACNQPQSTAPAEEPETPEVVVPDTVVPAHFESEDDVRDYLCAHTYKSDENFVIAFADHANAITYNEMLVATVTMVVEFTDSSAVLKGSGALGESTIEFTSKKTGNVLEDKNDGVLYWEQKQ